MSSYCCEARLPFRFCPAEGALYLLWTQLMASCVTADTDGKTNYIFISSLQMQGFKSNVKRFFLAGKICSKMMKRFLYPDIFI